MSPRTPRSKASSARGRKTTRSRTNGSKSSNKKAKRVEDADQYTESEDGDEYVADPGDDASDAESLHSDALDDEDEFETSKNSKKRKRASTSPKKTPSKSATKAKQANKNGSASGSARKKRKTKESEDEASDFELEDGQEVVGTVVQAPKTGRVPPGQISKNTFDFLSELRKPECNDREWFKLHEPVFRLAESEWKAFVEHFTDLLVEADPQIPHLPPKDVVYRIYRDVRFSNDKTPYKTGFSASFSRSGRKGIFAKYHVAVKPGGQSLIAAGSWCPGKNELATIRNNIKRSSRRLRQIISAPDFEALFGPAQPHPKGERQNIFGMEDELKVAPKGVDKTHKDIDLLKCRSFVVVYRFTDKQVLQPEFKEELANVVRVMRPFVHCLNDLMTIPDAGDSSSSEEEDGDEQDEDEGEE